jgi:hypothetical protein
MHPCVKQELSTRAFGVKTLQRLGITQEPVAPVGRSPGGGLGIRGSRLDAPNRKKRWEM